MRPNTHLMTTTDQGVPTRLEQARARIARTVFEDHLGGPELGCIGLEPEYFILRTDARGTPLGRFALEGEGGVLAILEELRARPRGPSLEGLKLSESGPPPIYELAHGGRLTFEPGAQIEHSTAVHEDAARAMQDVDSTFRELADGFAAHGGVIASAGLDLWTDRNLVAQQLRAPRYDAMSDYFDSRSRHGRVMMRHTASLQVNLDLGEREMAVERWRLANLLSPIATASFAASPEDGWRTKRARSWQGLDSTRTGFPREFLECEDVDPGEAYAEFALGADVMLFHAQNSSATALGVAGFCFRDWIEQGHPEHGFPTEEDLDYHLTTLFPEVRLRGFLEIRSADALPPRWRAAEIVFYAGLIYDEQARRAALELLEPLLPELSLQWVLAAREGLSNPALRDLASAVWKLALEGAGRLPAGYFRPADLDVATAFSRDFVRQGRSPADALRDLLSSKGPEAALAWAAREM